MSDPNYPEKIEHTYEFVITKGQKPERLDSFITHSVTNATRTRVQRAIDAGEVLVNGIPSKANYKIRPADVIRVTVMKPPPMQLIPQDLNLTILYQDDDVIVVDKPAGMPTHPGIGNRSGTLVNGVLWELGVREAIDLQPEETDAEEEGNEEASGLDDNEGAMYTSDAVRPGIVHRLDKDTSGVMVVAKNYESSLHLANQFRDRTASRQYVALVWGVVKETDWLIEGEIGHSTRNRKLYAVVPRGGKYAATQVTVHERFDCATLISCKLRTGRTHQIRVHLSSSKHPIIGDVDYGGGEVAVNGVHHMFRKTAQQALNAIQRQALHARTLGFTHPSTKQWMEFESPIPADIQSVLDILRPA